MISSDKHSIHFQVIIFLTIFVYPLWKIIVVINLDHQEPWHLRTIPMMFGFTFLFASKFINQLKKHYRSFLLFLSCFVILEFLHYTAFLYQTSQYVNHVVGSFIITAAFINTMKNKKDLAIFTLFSFTCYGMLFYYVQSIKSSPENAHHLLLAITILSVNSLITWRNIQGEIQMALLQKEIDAQRAQLIQSSKLASLGEMAGGIAHEINNPLQIISGNVEILEVIPDDPEALSTIKDTVNRIYKIIEGLKLFSRDSENTAKEPTLISDVLNETLSFCSERFKKHGVVLETNISDEVYIKCNHVELSRVFLNLLNNAFDAIAEENPDVKKVSINTSVNNNELTICFSDSGKKISPELKEKIFNPFFTTKSIGKGTGIGLSLSKGIIESHGGNLDLMLDPKEFVIKLPINDL